jgi:hypothetical protein
MFSFLNNQSSCSDPRSLDAAFPTIDKIPASARGYELNNQHKHFPPLMSDGRSVIAAWQPEAYVDDAIKNTHRITSNWEYRKYLTNNAESIMRHNFAEACNDVGYFVNENGWMSQQSPVQNSQPQPTTSDLKQLYLSVEQLDARRHAPVLTQDELHHLRLNK